LHNRLIYLNQYVINQSCRKTDKQRPVMSSSRLESPGGRTFRTLRSARTHITPWLWSGLV